MAHVDVLVGDVTASPQARMSRRQEILEALARELEAHPGTRVTTARLAVVVGVSEAALYRHFPSKAKMYEALIEFAEESVFGVVNRTIAQSDDGILCCERILGVVLTFSSRNPGITRVLLGEALVGENLRLRGRVAQFFERLESQLRQALRTALEHAPTAQRAAVSQYAHLLMTVIEGRMTQFCRSDFRLTPTLHWAEHWTVLRRAMFDGPGH